MEGQSSSSMVYAHILLWFFPLLLQQCPEHTGIVTYQLVNARQYAINTVGAAEPSSSCNGKNDEDHARVLMVLNSTTNSTSNCSGKETVVRTTCVVFFSLHAPTILVLFLLSDDIVLLIQRMRAVNGQIHFIGIPDDENGSDENEKKMKVIIFSLTLDYTKSSIAPLFFLTAMFVFRVDVVSSSTLRSAHLLTLWLSSLIGLSVA